MTDMPAAAGSGRAPGRAEPGLILRHDLVAALNRAAQKQVTIISAPAGTGKTSLLRAWTGRPGQDCRVAFLTVRPGQQDMQLFWLTMLAAIRAAAGTGDGCAPLPLPPPTPGASGSAMVDKVLSELEESCDRFVLVIDDLHELSAPEAAGQLTTLLTRLPPDVRAIVATRRDLPLRLHKLRLAGDLAEIRAAELRFTERRDPPAPRRCRNRAARARGRDAASADRGLGGGAAPRHPVHGRAPRPRTVRRRVLGQRPHGG